MGRKRRPASAGVTGNGSVTKRKVTVESAMGNKSAPGEEDVLKTAGGQKSNKVTGNDAKKREKQKNAQGKHTKGKTTEKKKKHRALWIMPVLAAIFVLVMILLRSCSADVERLILDMPEFEEDIRGGDGGEDGDENRVNLAVVPDFEVSKDQKDFPLPYPEENVFDVEFTFVDEKGKEVYRTKRIKPGTLVSIPAYDFCADGEHTYQIQVEVYDKDTYKPVQSAVALEMKITRK